MTVPQERENDALVLDVLGFGTPARLDESAFIPGQGELRARRRTGLLDRDIAHPPRTA